MDCQGGWKGKPVIVMGLSLRVQDLGCSQERAQQESRVPSSGVQGAGGDWHAGCCSYKSNKGTKVCGCHYPGGRHGLCDWRLRQVGISETFLAKP